jgi:hypothetical protein
LKADAKLTTDWADNLSTTMAVTEGDAWIAPLDLTSDMIRVMPSVHLRTWNTREIEGSEASGE